MEEISGLVLMELLTGELTSHDCLIVEDNRVIIENVIIGKNNGRPRIPFDINFKKNITFKNCIFNIRVSFISCEFNAIRFSGGTIFNKGLYFKRCKAVLITFNDVEFMKMENPSNQINFSYVNLGRISFYNSKNIRSFIDNGYIDNLSYYSCENLELTIQDKRTVFNYLGFSDLIGSNRVVLRDITIDKVNIEDEISRDSRLEMYNLNIRILDFSSLINKGVLLFNTIKFKIKRIQYSSKTIKQFFEEYNYTQEQRDEIISDLSNVGLVEDDDLFMLSFDEDLLDELNKGKNEVKDLDNKYEFLYSEMGLDEMELGSQIQFHAFELGNCKLSNCTFEKGVKLKVKDTELDSLKLKNCELPIVDLETNESNYEIFNDLYSIAKKQHNKEREVSYYSTSQEALLEKLRSDEDKDLASIWSLRISKYYSRFGTDWIRSIKVTVIFPLLLFLPMVLLSGYYPCGSIDCFFTFFDVASGYLLFLNPAHKLNFMGDIEMQPLNNFGFVFFDMIGRIIIGIGIFETIRSFRKFTRK